MIEIVFSDSAGGCLKEAQRYGRGEYPYGRGERPGLIYYGAKGEKPDEAEVEAFLKKYHETARLNWERAEPMGGRIEDIYDFDLGLSVGDIQGDELDWNRLDFLRSVIPPGAGFDVNAWLQKKYQRYRDGLDSAFHKIKEGQPVRIWYSRNPDEYCGMLWFLWKMRQEGVPCSQVYLVKMPDWDYDEASKSIIEFTGWGEVSTWRWSHYAKQTVAVPEMFCKRCAGLWEDLRQQNAPLRALVNGRVVSVPEDFYDHYIWKEIESLSMEQEEFGIGRIVGQALGHCQFGVCDSWYALRIMKFLEKGLLEVVKEPEDGHAYSRIVRKVTGI